MEKSHGEYHIKIMYLQAYSKLTFNNLHYDIRVNKIPIDLDM